MKTRRQFVLTLTAGLVALAVVITPVIAEELLGVLTKIEDDGKKLTVISKEDGKDVMVTTTDDTEFVSQKGSFPFHKAAEKVSEFLTKAQENGLKGLQVKVTHEKGVASKIQIIPRKKAAN